MVGGLELRAEPQKRTRRITRPQGGASGLKERRVQP
jgi:hypothetical protein